MLSLFFVKTDHYAAQLEIIRFCFLSSAALKTEDFICGRGQSQFVYPFIVLGNNRKEECGKPPSPKGNGFVSAFPTNLPPQP